MFVTEGGCCLLQRRMLFVTEGDVVCYIGRCLLQGDVVCYRGGCCLLQRGMFVTEADVVY